MVTSGLPERLLSTTDPVVTSLSYKREKVLRLTPKCLATAASVARHFGVSRSTILRLQDRLVTTGSVADRTGVRPGRPSVTTAAEDRRMRTIHLRDRFKSVSSTAREWDCGDVSRLTIGRRLRQGGIKCRLPCKKKFISIAAFRLGKLNSTLNTYFNLK